MFRLLILKDKEEVTNTFGDECKNCLNKLDELKEKKCHFSGKNVILWSAKKDDVEIKSCSSKDLGDRKRFIKKVKAYFDIVDDMLDIKKSEYEKARDIYDRIFHNIKSHNAKNLQEVYLCLPDSETRDVSFKKCIDDLRDYVYEQPENVAKSLFRILKNTSFIKSEMFVLSNMYGSTIKTDPKYFKIHKMVMASLYPYFIDFTEKHVYVRVHDCEDSLLLDYNTTMIAMHHIINNAVKYCLPDQQIDITFEDKKDVFIIDYNMMSIRIKDDEIEKIFDQGYSGFYAQKIKQSGGGIGLNVVRKLLAMNNAELLVNRIKGIRPSVTYEENPYDNNIFSMVFKKAF